jgi:transcriptional regulator with XRE-family HTH domain
MSPPPDGLWSREDMRSALADRDVARIFKIYRRMTGSTQQQIGEAIGEPQSHVSAIERGKRRVESLATFERIAAGLDIPRRLLGLADSASPDDQQVAYVVSAHSPEQIRQQLNDALTVGAMSEASLDDWEATVFQHGRRTRDRPAGVSLNDLTNDLAELGQAFDRTRSASTLRSLTRIASQMSGLMCLTYCRLGDGPAFRRWARTARLSATESGDSATLSWVLAQEAYGHYYDSDPARAVEVARHAQSLVSKTPTVGAALAAALEARAHAAMGQHSETREAVQRAEAILGHLAGDALIPSAFGYTEAQLRFHEGNALTLLGDAEGAMRAQDDALRLCAPGDYTDWAMTRLDRAQCLILARDGSSALTYAIQTFALLTPPQRRGIIAHRGSEILSQASTEYETSPEFQEFRELLMSTPTQEGITGG